MLRLKKADRAVDAALLAKRAAEMVMNPLGSSSSSFPDTDTASRVASPLTESVAMGVAGSRREVAQSPFALRQQAVADVRELLANGPTWANAVNAALSSTRGSSLSTRRNATSSTRKSGGGSGGGSGSGVRSRGRGKGRARSGRGRGRSSRATIVEQPRAAPSAAECDRLIAKVQVRNILSHILPHLTLLISNIVIFVLLYNDLLFY